MTETATKRDGYKVIERRCRIVMDVNIHISEITPQSVAEYFTPDEAGEGISWEWAERQNRLLALIQDEEAVEPFLLSFVTDDLGFLLEGEQIKGLEDEEEDELFEKVYSQMNGEDRLFFEEAKRDGSLYHNIELIHRAFVTDWKRAELKSVCVLKQDKDEMIEA